ncbi:hypothetical protein AB0J83_40375 [Actinoplanes sp. NPDC049596]|uniref:hypothetical protein n=1 Tax=unclassified Actinoplanes TaxID=2626549 RepID=UPI003418930D
MSESRLLGHLAGRFAFSEENIATESLAYLMRSAAARAAMSSLIRTTGYELPEGLAYVGQAGRQDQGRPDVMAYDGDHVERLLIEGKFAAGLTDQQPWGYLERLPADKDGALLVVAPSVRLPTLWFELLRALPEFSGLIPAPSSIGSESIFSTAIDDHRVLILTSWRYVVKHLLEALRAADERTLAADAEQLLSLTETMDSTAFAPLRSQDLNQRTGQQVNQLRRLIDSTKNGLTTVSGSRVATAGKVSHGRFYYGCYLRSRHSNVQMWFGFLPRAWARYGLSPLWLQTTRLWHRERWLQALGALNEPGQPGLFDEADSGFLVPVHLPTYAGEAEMVSDLRRQIEAIFARLDAVVPAGEPPAPAVEITEPQDEEEDLQAG